MYTTTNPAIATFLVARGWRVIKKGDEFCFGRCADKKVEKYITGESTVASDKLVIAGELVEILAGQKEEII